MGRMEERGRGGLLWFIVYDFLGSWGGVLMFEDVGLVGWGYGFFIFYR